MTQLLTTDQVANRLQVHRETVLRWVRNGELGASKIARKWRISEEDLSTFLDQRRPTTVDSV
jgi:excisionase family DNA binding protein